MEYQVSDVTVEANQPFGENISYREEKISDEQEQRSRSGKYDHLREDNNPSLDHEDFLGLCGEKKNTVTKKYLPYQTVIIYVQNRLDEASQEHPDEAGEQFSEDRKY